MKFPSAKDIRFTDCTVTIYPRQVFANTKEFNMSSMGKKGTSTARPGGKGKGYKKGGNYAVDSRGNRSSVTGGDNPYGSKAGDPSHRR
jgi:hypothetical protein